MVVVVVHLVVGFILVDLVVTDFFVFVDLLIVSLFCFSLSLFSSMSGMDFFCVDFVLNVDHWFVLSMLSWNSLCWIDAVVGFFFLDVDSSHLNELDELDLSRWPCYIWPLSMCSVNAFVVLDLSRCVCCTWPLSMFAVDALVVLDLFRCTCCTWPLPGTCPWPLSMYFIELNFLLLTLWIIAQKWVSHRCQHLTLLTSVNELDHNVL